MLDDIFTYGGGGFGLAAFGLWLWFALRALPSFEAIVARYEDDLCLSGLELEAEQAMHSGKLTRLAVSVTALSLFLSAVGYAIPG